ncbi:ABC transporter ATP-binding protein [Thioclava atlantica]|uniref:Oligopeptide/dipeptide ABC transporter ATPase n=1 Tax=Thioclava atlantica TaxID=1317124 RepID=A0A085TW29_9RHOB|nr:oligopeptide/dipeptide ABC transporter ATP-binding protein [Thioclava atlantica]KFE34926.1 oligopeptide/dipeptide ABC transporter ATPase [Thioclava atlantica]
MNRVILEAIALERRFTTDNPMFGTPTVVHAVNGVNLKVRQGETFAIVGESGCGKSTLARVLTRLIPASGGAVHFAGRDLSLLKPAEVRALRREIQFIFQDPFSSLNPRMTVGALIEEPMRVHKIGTRAERRARVGQLLERVGLPAQAASRFPHEFSGGQRQRIGIARALASEPTVVIGDEPVSALDVSIQAQVVNLLADLKEEFGLTLVVIAHDLAVIRHMADRVAVMYLGEIVELAPAEALFETPRHPYTEALVAAIPLPDPAMRRAEARVAGELPNPIAPPPGCKFHPRCPYAVERCARERPALSPADAQGRQVACHRAADLSLSGLAETETVRSPAAQRRFDLYAKARAAEATTE